MFLLLSAIICVAIFVWIYVYQRLVQVINYYQTVNMSMILRCQTLAELTAEIVWRTSATTEDKRAYRRLIKELNKNTEPQPPAWMRGTFTPYRTCPYCGLTRLRRDKYGGLKICRSCTKIK